MAHRSAEVADSSEFTLSTDQDVSESSTATPSAINVGGGGESRRAIRAAIDRQQLQHDLQLARLELNQRNTLYESQRVEYEAREEELRERLLDLQHQKKILQARLETELEIQREKSRQHQEKLSRELEEVLTRQRDIETQNARLVAKAADLRSLFDGSLNLSEEEYQILRSRPEKELSLRDWLLVRLHETALQPARQEVREARLRTNMAERELAMSSEEVARLSVALTDEQEQHRAVKETASRALGELADTRAQLQRDNYRIDNFERVAEDAEMSARNVTSLQERLASLEAAYERVTAERDELSREAASQRQSASLLRQDKEYLVKQNGEMASRVSRAEERLQEALRQADDAKNCREQMYNKMTQQLDESRSKYEQRLADEVDAVRRRAEMEIERLRCQSRELSTQELAGLREQRDTATLERDRALAAARSSQESAELTREELMSCRSMLDSRLTELTAELKLKSWQAERSEAALRDALVRLQESQLEAERQSTKAAAAAAETARYELEGGRRVAELELRCADQTRRLDAYEAVERELDLVVMQAAELEGVDGVEADKLVNAYGQGASLPASARRRMQQSVELARRVLQLERRCRELVDEAASLRTERDAAQTDLNRLESTLQEAQQPYSYLVDVVRKRDNALLEARQQVEQVKKECSTLRKRVRELAQGKNALTADLERMLNQRDELANLRHLVTQLQQPFTPALKNQVSPQDRPNPIHFQNVANKKSDNRPYGLSYS